MKYCGRDEYNNEWDGDIYKWKQAGHPVKVYRTINARELWNKIIHAAWRSAEPGIIFEDEIRKNWTISSPFHGVNPCAEIVLSDNEPCDLGHVALDRFVNQDQSFNVDGYIQTIHVATIGDVTVAPWFGWYCCAASPIKRSEDATDRPSICPPRTAPRSARRRAAPGGTPPRSSRRPAGQPAIAPPTPIDPVPAARPSERSGTRITQVGSRLGQTLSRRLDAVRPSNPHRFDSSTRRTRCLLHRASDRWAPRSDSKGAGPQPPPQIRINRIPSLRRDRLHPPILTSSGLLPTTSRD